ncbi:MAG: arylsulfatase [Planctomycetes bacterium]|nr:arylsulfatase [Planctomycetota bacterium]
MRPRRRPNFVLIMADDMGYSDLACFGGTIRTPNLDRLASEGIAYTSFYNTPRCCPSRAALMTGLYPHQAGMGWMTALNMGLDGYEGNLNRRCRTIAEVLKPAGYRSYMCGKWHLSRREEGLPDARPLSRGFDRFFGTTAGGGSYWNPKPLLLGTEPAPRDPETFYYTDAISDHACAFLDEHYRDTPEAPLFAYVAYTAPHWPLHAKPEDIDRYRGKFSKGWDVLRQEKYERMLGRKLLEKGWGLSGRDAEVPAWDSLPAEKREEFDLRMAIYAAQVDCMDQGIGRIMQCLRRHGAADDTLVLFLSDNGGCHEEIHWQTPELALFGTDKSYESYGRPWANYSNAPFRMFKSWVHEGGIATPLVAHWPNGITTPGTVSRRPGHITDIMPTFCELAGARYPAGGDDRVHELVGTSMAPGFCGGNYDRERMFWEHEGNRGIRMDSWKLVADGVDGPWELYDMEADRTELRNLAAADPRRVEAMAAQWHDIALATNVYPLDGRKWNERIEAFKKKQG